MATTCAKWSIRTVEGGLLVLLGLTPATALAQADRYELGQRLRRYETVWEERPDAADRRRALPAVKKAMATFLYAGAAGDVGRSLDQACFALRSADAPPDAAVWAASLMVRPAARLVDAGTEELAVEVKPFYDAKVPGPADGRLRLTLLHPAERSACASRETEFAALPLTAKLPLKDRHGPAEGDFTLRVEVRSKAGGTLATRDTTLSFAKDLRPRLDKLDRRRNALVAGAGPVEVATLPRLRQILHDLADGKVLETDYPAARLLAEAEVLTETRGAGERYYGPKRAGQFWLTVPAGAGRAVVRLGVPESAAKGGKLPVLFALHGAGGSENLYFDGYGRGAAWDECRKRGWLLVGTRSESFLKPPPVPAILDALAAYYPIDRKRAYLMGHSMGAAQVVTLAQQAAGQFAGVAVLGGGGSVREPAAVKGVPFFVGCGTEDFLRGGFQALRRDLAKAGADPLLVKEYEGIEHLTVVRTAVPDVFAFFTRPPAP